ncbi:hypothetical protein C8A03DRAFT_33355 [Achaetomium macrosporum]|uniref:Uncharacterized protein n=1 Tax=Achaetomium macrosporum TaxID=79813 RepID=A0AAN7CC60_9PEZI|nr:hypothetical protein C8A03DRAFT_33355 [Achaetomium macrosporum]
MPPGLKTIKDIHREYLPEAAFFPVDETKPHVACFTIDSKDAPGDEVLRSDIHYAIELAKFGLENGQHTKHHTKPGIIYTLERDQFARITQVYFDGKTNKLVLRQSRQLDLRGAQPTEDACLPAGVRVMHVAMKLLTCGLCPSSSERENHRT